jgi:hypothetical protein
MGWSGRDCKMKQARACSMPPDLWDSACRRDAQQGRVGWLRVGGGIAAGAGAATEMLGIDVSLWVVYGAEGHGTDSGQKGPALQTDMHEAGHERSEACLGPDDELIRVKNGCPFPAETQ